MIESIPQITTKYLEGKTLREFADSLGINAKFQSIDQWKRGVHAPSFETLKEVADSMMATYDAKAWADECCFAYYGVHIYQVEPTLDEEIERRR